MLRAVRLLPWLVASAALLAPSGCAMLRGHTPPDAPAEFWGFTAPWDPRSAASVAAHGATLDAVVSGFIVLDSSSLRPVARYTDSLPRNNAGNPRYMALVTTYEGSRFHATTVRALASDSAALGKSAGATAELAAAAGYRGIVLDLEGLTPDDLDALLRVTRALRDSAHAHGIAPVTLAIPAMDTAAYPGRPLATVADLLLVMLYDEHWLTSVPGPIASPAWVRQALGVRSGETGGARLVAALPTYGYEWRAGRATEVVSYEDAVALAARGNVPLVRDPASGSLHADTGRWHVWVSDAVLDAALVRQAREAGVTRFAFWRLGTEDPRLWTDVVPRHRARRSTLTR